MATPNPIPATAPLIPPSDAISQKNGAPNSGTSLMPSVSPNPTASATNNGPGAVAPPNPVAKPAVPAPAAPKPPAPPGPNPTTAPANPPASTTPPAGPSTTPAPTKDESITGHLDEMLKSGSPYLELAKSQAQQAAAARGMQNSSIAAGSGEAAAIAAAAPIATAQAQMEQQASLQKEAEAAQINNILTQGSVQEKLQSAQNEFTKMINDINNGQQITMANLAFQNQMKLTAAQGGIDLQKIQAQTAGTIAQINAQAAATASQYGPALQSQYLQQVATIMQSNNQAITSIYTTQGLTSAQQQAAVAATNASMQQQLKNLAAFYASSPLWLTGQNPAPIPGSRGPNGTTPPKPLVPPSVGNPPPVIPPNPGGAGGGRR